MADAFSDRQSGLESPAGDAAAITPDDSNDLPTSARAIYVGGGGDIVLDTVKGETSILFKAVPQGTILPVRAKRVRASSTTATNLIALW